MPPGSRRATTAADAGPARPQSALRARATTPSRARSSQRVPRRPPSASRDSLRAPGIEAQDRLAQVAQHDQAMTAARRQVKRAVALRHRHRERSLRRRLRTEHADTNVDRQRPDPHMCARHAGCAQRDQRGAGNDQPTRTDATTPTTTAWPASPAGRPTGTATGTAHARSRDRRSHRPPRCARSRAPSPPRSASSSPARRSGNGATPRRVVEDDRLPIATAARAAISPRPEQVLPRVAVDVHAHRHDRGPLRRRHPTHQLVQLLRLQRAEVPQSGSMNVTITDRPR